MGFGDVVADEVHAFCARSLCFLRSEFRAGAAIVRNDENQRSETFQELL